MNATTLQVISVVVIGGVVYYAMKQHQNRKQQLPKLTKINKHPPPKPQLFNTMPKIAQKSHTPLIKSNHYI